MRTLNVLIVDDEAFIVDWLSSLMYAQSDLSLNLFSCYGVTEARKIIDAHRIDILLTDIRMPDGNGLDLASTIHSRWADCKVLMLTAFSEFEYAKKAIHSGVDSYILKTENDDFILAEMRRVIFELNRKLDERQQNFILKRDLDHYMALYQNSLFIDWLRDGFISKEQQDRCLSELGVNPLFPCYLVLGRILTKHSDAMGLNAMHARISFQCMAEEMSSCFLSSIQDDDLYFLLQPKPDYFRNYQGLLKDTLDIVQHSLNELYKFEISFVISSAVSDPGLLANDCRKMRAFLKTISPDSGAFLYCMNMSSPVKKMQFGFLAAAEALSDALERGDEDAFDQLLEQMQIVSNNDTYPVSYLCAALPIIEYSVEDTSDSFIDVGAICDFIVRGSSIEAFAYLRTVGNALFAQKRRHQLDDKQRLVERIDQFLAENANHDLSISDVSDYFNYNADYLSRIYAAASGVTLKKAISQKRLAFVMQLMQDASLSLNEVAERSHFKSRTYFNFFIKHMLGMTPSQYRQTLGSDGNKAHENSNQ